jgi:hypothetical protein
VPQKHFGPGIGVLQGPILDHQNGLIGVFNQAAVIDGIRRSPIAGSLACQEFLLQCRHLTFQLLW